MLLIFVGRWDIQPSPLLQQGLPPPPLIAPGQEAASHQQEPQLRCDPGGALVTRAVRPGGVVTAVVRSSYVAVVDHMFQQVWTINQSI